MTGAIIPQGWDGLSYTEYCVSWPDNTEWAALLRGALSQFAFDRFWDSNSGDVDSAVSEAEVIISTNTQGGLFPPVCVPGVDEMPAGMIVPFGGLIAQIPTNWTLCDGSELIDETPYKALLVAAGMPFGNNGAGRPLLPNLNQRFLYGTTNQDIVGQASGAETHTLTTGEMPQHSHAAVGGGSYFIRNPGSAAIQFGAGGDVYSFQADTQLSGSGGAHNNMPPFIRLLYIVNLGTP